MSKHLTSTIAIFLCLFMFPTSIMGQEKETRTKAAKLQKDGNYKEALKLYESLLTETNDDKSFSDLEDAIRCLSKLNRISEADGLLEKQITLHPKNLPFLITSGRIYASELPHSGSIIAGNFQRGNHRGGGQYANSSERDRIRAIQLQIQALQLQSAPHSEKIHAYSELHLILMINREGSSAWKFQPFKATD